MVDTIKRENITGKSEYDALWNRVRDYIRILIYI